MKNSNTGDWNTGNWNTGDWNTGNWNTGDWNTGNRNAGDRNTGDRNTGDWNTGNWNAGDWNTGDCNTDRPKVRLFNRATEWEFFGEDHLRFRNKILELSSPLCEWVSDINMDDSEKEEHPTHKTTGGYLKVNSKGMKKEISQEDINYFKSLPNFDQEILFETTGIDITSKKVKIVIDGKEFNVKRESLKDIEKLFV